MNHDLARAFAIFGIAFAVATLRLVEVIARLLARVLAGSHTR
jgi:hypothetical protein